MQLIATLLLFFLTTMPAHALEQPTNGTKPETINTVNVGSFVTDLYAKAFYLKLQDHGFHPELLKIYDSNGKLWNIIHIGKYARLEDAKLLASKYEKQTGKKATIKKISLQKLEEFKNRAKVKTVKFNKGKKYSKNTNSNEFTNRIKELQQNPLKLSQHLVKIIPSIKSISDIKTAAKQVEKKVSDETYTDTQKLINVEIGNKKTEHRLSNIADEAVEESIDNDATDEPIDDYADEPMEDDIADEPMEEDIADDSIDYDADEPIDDEISDNEPIEEDEVTEEHIEEDGIADEPIEDNLSDEPLVEDTNYEPSIIDDSMPTINFTQSKSAVNEGELLTVTLKLDSSSDQNISVPIILSGTATLGMDYFLISQNPIIIPTGETTAELSISVTTDWNQDDKETVTLKIGPPNNANVGTTNMHTSTLTDVSY
ncbi:MAG: hypothetical protein HQL71_03550 [Magnetococcales bacterium]|nr:hypothetical protein [Magnetococcales bacterium]